MIKISVVIPVYGVEKYIDQLLDSLRRQKLEDIEFILVDDGSPDNCPQILDAYAAEDSRCKVIHQPNGGVSAARNTGLAQASGEYVYIIDSDDWMTDNALEVLWNEAQRTGADVIYGDWIGESDAGSKLVHPFPRPFVTEDKDTVRCLQQAVFSNSNTLRVNRPEFETVSLGGAPWRALLRRSLITDNNLAYDPYVKGLGDDILFMLHYYEHVNKVAYIAEPIYHYRQVAASYSHGYKANLLEVYRCIFERMEKFLDENNKDEFCRKGYYLRVMVYFTQAMMRYFKNTHNPKPEKERFEEMKALLKTEPYKTAVKKVDPGMLTATRMKIGFTLLKMGMYKAYWLLKK